MEVASKQVKAISSIAVLAMLVVVVLNVYQSYFGLHNGVKLTQLSSETEKRLLELEKFDSHPGLAVGYSGTPSHHYELYHTFYKELTAEEAKELINHSNTLIKSTAFRKLYQEKSPLLFDLMLEASKDTVSMVYEDDGCLGNQYSLFGYYLKVCKYPKPFNIKSINADFTPGQIQQIDSLAKALFESDSKELERMPQILPVSLKTKYDNAFETTFESGSSKLNKNILTFYTETDSTQIPIPAIMDIGEECTFENQNQEKIFVFRTNYTDYRYRLVTKNLDELGAVTLYPYFYFGIEFRGLADELPVTLFHPIPNTKQIHELGMGNTQLSSNSIAPFVTVRLQDSIQDLEHPVFYLTHTHRMFHYSD